MDRKIRILAAEADSGFRKMVEDALRESRGSYVLKKVSTGEECLKNLKKEKFDVLLLDHTLPDGDGLDWLRKFNEEGIGVPTIFVTPKGDPRLALAAMKEGVFDYINRSAECAKAFPFVIHRAVEGHSLMVEKVRLQKELIETKNFLESIVEKAGDAISVVDLEGKILYWNEGAERIFGYSREEGRGKNLFGLLAREDKKKRAAERIFHQELLDRVLQGESISQVEVKRRAKDGREILISMTLSPLRNAERKIVGISRICRDITDQKKAEERLLLTERLSSVGELTAGVAHELRNPLAGIKLNNQILSRRKDLPEMETKVVAIPYLTKTTNLTDEYGFAYVTFIPGKFNETEYRSVTGECNITATWNSINRQVTPVWKNYGYLKVTTWVDNSSITENQTVEVGVEVFADGPSFNSLPIDMIFCTDRGASMLWDTYDTGKVGSDDKMRYLYKYSDVILQELNECPEADECDRAGVVSFGPGNKSVR